MYSSLAECVPKSIFLVTEVESFGLIFDVEKLGALFLLNNLSKIIYVSSFNREMQYFNFRTLNQKGL